MEKKYTAALISLGSESSLRTLAAMQNYFATVDDVRLQDIEIVIGQTGAQPLFRGEPLKSYDCVYIKGSYKYADIAKSIASLLHGKCFQPLDPSSFTTVHNKLLTHLELQKYDTPMPKTYLISSNQGGKKLLQKISFPIIVKLPEGTQGKGVMFADSFAAASSLFDTLKTLNQPFIIQEYIETGGEDLRVIVVGDKVVASMRRKASDGEVRSNYHAGGSVEASEVSEQVKKLSVKVAKALKAQICGVDILEGPKGPLIIEVNLSPGLQGIMKATNRDIPDDIAAYLFRQTDVFVKEKSQAVGVSASGTSILENLGIGKLEAVHDEDRQQIITPLDFRGMRILLPEIVTRLGQIKEDIDYVVEVRKDCIKIKKM